jgi:uncharacterized protein YjbI with pentapeptide repeats
MGRVLMRTPELVEPLKAHTRFTHSRPGGRRLQMRLASLQGIKLPGIDLREAILSGADLSDTVLTEASFDRADLYGADFSGADLRLAMFCSADIRGAVFRGASMAGADLTGADLRPGAYADSGLKLVGAQKTARHRARQQVASRGWGDRIQCS